MARIISSVSFCLASVTWYYTNYEDGDEWYFIKSTKGFSGIADLQHATLVDKSKICAQWLPEYTLFPESKVDESLYLHKRPMNTFVGYEYSYLNSMKNEIEAYEKIRKHGGHRNICAYHGCTRVSDFVSGLVLTRYPRMAHELPKMDEESIELFMDKLTNAVKFLHSIGVVHGDLSHLNIMVDDDSEPIIIDFDSSGPNNPKLGSPGYMREKYKKTEDDDVYALQKIREYFTNR